MAPKDPSEHDWKLQSESPGLDGIEWLDGDDKIRVWRCRRCGIIAKFRSNAIPSPGFRADLHPCDATVVRGVMES